MNIDKKVKNTILELIHKHNTIDIFKICELEGIQIRFKDYNTEFLKGRCVKLLGKWIIYINCNYNLKSQQLLCAHEIGHIMLHKNSNVNDFDGSDPVLEFEANLFAAHYMFDERDYDLKFSSMNNYLLKNVIDENLILKIN